MNQAMTSVNTRMSPAAAAFWDYLVASQLVVEVIPGHVDYVDRIETNRGHLHREFNQLAKA